MPERPYVLLSVAASVDGYIDDTTSTRLLLSNDADFDRVDEVRASADAILAGANTIRRDNPRLLVRSAPRRAVRAARGLPENPIKVTLTSSGDLDPAASFFTAGQASKIVYASSPAVAKTREQLADVATVVDAGDPPSLPGALADLAARGVRRLMVEGGGTIHRQFLTAGLADEIHLVIAPFFVGDPAAPRFPGDGAFPYHPGNRMELAEVRQIGDVVLLRLGGQQPGVHLRDLPAAVRSPAQRGAVGGLALAEQQVVRLVFDPLAVLEAEGFRSGAPPAAGRLANESGGGRAMGCAIPGQPFHQVTT